MVLIMVTGFLLQLLLLLLRLRLLLLLWVGCVVSVTFMCLHPNKKDSP